MSTDFFERQDNARRLTTRLLVLFSLSVIAIILAVYFALAATIVYGGRYTPHRQMREVERIISDPLGTPQVSPPPPPSLWQPKLFLGVVAGVVIVITLGSLYKTSELSSGGENVALMLGGRAIDPQTRDLAERRLLNIVEEMALASGIPVPPVYVLDNERAINAFAAGHEPGDAVVAVSDGCLRYLTREELQGVVAHEFSHILNGDMRLNLRLIGIVYGILILAIIGYYAMRSAHLLGSGDSRKGGGAAAVFVAGVVLCILGYLGVFFGKLIKSAISRQREYLADASAVQFTRNPNGIAGALKKIGGLSVGSHIQDAHAQEISHMFFGDAFAGSFFNLLATHPPLAERIKALEPSFDGNFPEVRPVAISAADVETPARTARPSMLPLPIPGMPAVGAAAAVMGLNSGNVTRRVGQIPEENLRQASQMIAAIPQSLLDAAREPFSAPALIFALLLSSDEAERAKQLQSLQKQITPPLFKEIQRRIPDIQSLAPAARLPLVDLTIPAMKRFSASQYAQIRSIIETLINADGKVDLFEFCLQMVLFSYLDVHFGVKKPPTVRYKTLIAAAQPVSAVLSSLAYVGHANPEDVRRAFEAGVRDRLAQAELLPREQCTLRAFDSALTELASVGPQVKREIIAAVTDCIAADGKMTVKESELLRAIAAVLACPIPPMTNVVEAG